MNKKNKTVKLAILIGQLSYYGGVGITAVNEVRELKKLGVQAELVVLYRKIGFDSKKIFGASDIPIIFLSDYLPNFLRINFKFPFFSFFSFFHVSSIFWAPFLIKKHQYDFIIVHETYNCFSAIVSAKFAKAKVISYVWDPISYIVPRIYGKGVLKYFLSPIKTISRFLDGAILKNSDLVFIGSSLHEKLLLSIYSKAKLIKISSATNILKNIPKKRCNFMVALTKWDQGKKPDFLLEVMRRLDDKVELVIAGDWPDSELKKNFERKIKDFKLEGRVKVVGKISEEEKFKLFSQARLLVHPIVEAFGMFALEAAACGCPYILPKNSGVNELFTEGKHAYFPKEGDVNDFVKYIKILLTDEKKAFNMGYEAWKNAHNYSWEVHAEKILSVVKKMSFIPSNFHKKASA